MLVLDFPRAASDNGDLDLLPEWREQGVLGACLFWGGGAGDKNSATKKAVGCFGGWVDGEIELEEERKRGTEEVQ